MSATARPLVTTLVVATLALRDGHGTTLVGTRRATTPSVPRTDASEA